MESYLENRVAKRITAYNYETKIFQISKGWLRFERSHRWNPESQEIDVFGNCWSIAWTDFTNNQVSVYSQNKLLALNGNLALLIPPRSIVDWRFRGGEIYWQAILSNESWPSDFPTKATAYLRSSNDYLPKTIDELRVYLNSHSILAPIERTLECSFVASKVQDFIHEHWDVDISIEALCKQMGYDHSVVDRSFKLAFGLSPIQYRNRMRIIDGAHRLLLGEGNVTDITFDVGFNGTSNFNKHFKKLMKVPPSQYVIQDR